MGGIEDKVMYVLSGEGIDLLLRGLWVIMTEKNVMIHEKCTNPGLLDLDLNEI